MKRARFGRDERGERHPTPTAMHSATSASHARRESSAGRGGRPSAKRGAAGEADAADAVDEAGDAPRATAREWIVEVMSCLRAAALQGEHPLRAFLDEQHDHHEHGDLREHRAPERLDRLADEPEAEAPSTVPAIWPTPPSTTAMNESTM